MKKYAERKGLVKEFCIRSEHSQVEIDRVLSAYFDPGNPEMGLEKFMETLSGLAVFGRDMSKNDMVVLKALLSVVEDVKQARLFNNTYIGHMLSEASIPGMLGYLIGIRTGSNTVAREVSIFESQVEPEAISGLASMIGFDPEKADGTFTSGGSMAMQTALMAARRKLIAEGKTATTAHPFLVLGTPYTHYSVAKMCDIVGGPSSLVVKKDIGAKNFKMDVNSLEKSLIEAKQNKDSVMAVVAIGGETETGIVDPIKEIADLAEKYKVPLIVDGAYGAPYRLSRNGKLFDGMERAFAVTLDPHKALATPYSNGAVIFGEAKDMYMGYGDRAAYLGKRANLGQKRIEGSMGAGAILSTIAVLRTLGFEGLATQYDLALDRIEHLYELVEKSRFLENLYQPELNLLCFTIKPEVASQMRLSTPEEVQLAIDEIREELDKGIQGLGGHFFSATMLPLNDGSQLPVFRACIMNPRTTDEILDGAIDSLDGLIEKRLA